MSSNAPIVIRRDRRRRRQLALGESRVLVRLLLATADPASFNEPLGHAAEIYFATTVLATVGFGAIRR